MPEKICMGIKTISKRLIHQDALAINLRREVITLFLGSNPAAHAINKNEISNGVATDRAEVLMPSSHDEREPLKENSEKRNVLRLERATRNAET
jgi:hypothetical protein